MSFLKKYWLWIAVGGVIVYFWYTRSLSSIPEGQPFINRFGQIIGAPPGTSGGRP